MAVSKFTTWNGSHKLGSRIIFDQAYDVYADMANAGATPYLRLNGCRFRTAVGDVRSWISNRAPFTVKIKVNGTGTTYSFNSGSTISHRNGTSYDEDIGQYTDAYYYITFSSTTNIPIPKNGTEFTLNITVTTKNNETYTIVEHACAPISNTLSGSTSINTGAVATYSLLTPVKNDAKHCAEAYMHVSFNNTSGSSYEGFADTYTPVNYKTTNFSSVSFVPLRGNASAGDVAKANANSSNYIVFTYYYYTNDTEFGTGSLNDKRIVISYYKVGVQVKARNEVNASLKPEFDSVVYMQHGSVPLSEQFAKYGAAVQNQGYYDAVYKFKCHERVMAPYPPHYWSNTGLKYGSDIMGVAITDYAGTSVVTKNLGASGTSFEYNRGYLTVPGSGLTIRYNVTDSFGFTTTYTDTFNVLSYSNPYMPVHRARRCEPVSSGSGSDYYTYNGQTYHISDYGEYVLIEWSVSVPPLSNLNSRSLTIQDTQGSNSITLPAYSCSGLYVAPANPEMSYDIVFYLSDDFHIGQRGAITYTHALNTILAAIDFLRGGTGLAFGKVAETAQTMDIHRDWTLKMPYDTMVQGYNSNGTAVRLYDWMQTTVSRMDAIVNARPVAIFYQSQLYSGSTAACIPSGYATLMPNWISIDDVRHNAIAGLLIEPGMKVNRNYLYVDCGAASFVGTGWTSTGPMPTLYVLTSKPTSINQSTGVPNGTVIRSIELEGTISAAGSASDGYRYWNGINNKLYIDVSSYKNQNIWVVLTCRNGGSSQQGTYSYYNASAGIDEMMFTNNRS